MKKLVRDGKVAIVHSDDWGSGWYTWHNVMELIFDPELVRMIENPDEDEDEHSIINYCRDKYGNNYYEGAKSLVISWLPQGTEFVIMDYDGMESVLCKNGTHWHTA